MTEVVTRWGGYTAFMSFLLLWMSFGTHRRIDDGIRGLRIQQQEILSRMTEIQKVQKTQSEIRSQQNLQVSDSLRDLKRQIELK